MCYNFAHNAIKFIYLRLFVRYVSINSTFENLTSIDKLTDICFYQQHRFSINHYPMQLRETNLLVFSYSMVRKEILISTNKVSFKENTDKTVYLLGMC